MKNVFLFSLLIVTIFSQTVITPPILPICSFDSDCNNSTTFGGNYCFNSTCLVKTSIPYKTIYIDTSTTCQSSYRFNGACSSLSTSGCPGTSLFTRCFASNFNFTTGNCDPYSTSSFLTVKLGARCDSSVSPQLLCEPGSVCIQKICRKKLALWDNCYSSQIPCNEGLICDVDICEPAFQRLPQSICKNSPVCTTGICLGGQCAETRSIPCWSNTDCQSVQPEVCSKPSFLQRGFCTSAESATRSSLARCMASACVISPSTCATDCSRSLAQSLCAINCKLSPELRLPNDLFYTDCSTFLRLPIPIPTCEITNTYFNCPSSIVVGGSEVSQISIVLAVVSILFLL